LNQLSDAKGTILLCEDNENLRKIYQDILSMDGYKVITADDGEQGWEMAKAHKPDFILLDLEMPKLNGFGVLELIKGNATTRTIPVIVFSAMHMEADVKKAMDLGANGYVIKGVHTPRYVLGTIKSLMPKKTLEPPPKPGAYKVQIKEYREDPPGQWSEILLTSGYRCPQCGDEFVLEIYPNQEKDGTHWFYSRFSCAKCGTFF
jgi:DNA-binding response OmpR family regulator